MKFQKPITRQGTWCRAFTLAEVVMALAISCLTVGGIVYGFQTNSQKAEWSAYSLASHSIAMQRMEQARAAQWDPLAFPAVDELVASNFPVTVNILDIPVTSKSNVNFSASVLATNFPMSLAKFTNFLSTITSNGVNFVYATNLVTISSISTNPYIKMVRVDCTWSFLSRGTFTNTVATYRTSDQ